MQFWLETDKAAYLLRQYFFNNLHDRLGTRPFLSLVEKRWLAFQVFLPPLPSLGVHICKLMLLTCVCFCYFCSYFMQWNRATRMEFATVSLVICYRFLSPDGFVIACISAGDIKCENVLVTSWNWLYLADFASFKPTYIPHDDPSDFSFFFDTGGRRRCYLAPEVRYIIYHHNLWFKCAQFLLL